MADTKTPGRKKAQAPSTNGFVLPSREAMEAYVSTIAEDVRERANEKAQTVMYDAWARKTSRSRTSLAHKALGISPLCADAYNLLAGEATKPEERRDLYERGLAAGELALSPEGFESFAGEFWGFLETRPYMRSRHGLALTLLQLGEEEAAIGHLRAMLELNPGDNQGIRYLLLAALLRRDDIQGITSLMAMYKDDWSVDWLYTRALLAFREGRADELPTAKLLEDARSANAHVPAILAEKEPPVSLPTGLIMMGGTEEAKGYVHQYGAAWRKTPGAIAWLVSSGAATPPKRRTSKSAR